MQEELRAYFRNRAENELKAGQAATVPEAARAHFLLAGYYFDRAFTAPSALANGAEPGSSRNLLHLRFDPERHHVDADRPSRGE